MAPTVHSRTLQRAAELLGGPAALSAHLDVPVRRLQVWMRGTVPAPDDIFLKAVDVVSDSELKTLRSELLVSAG